ncbi:MAG: Rrf2 family transcriptional regulator [Planctomyces sp.]|nr:Rrf2 family transcriptional regulator [Planctomyces sp.]
MISSTATYALRAVVYLASQSDRFICRSEISDATVVPHEYLLKVLGLLDSAGIVESRRGPGGGYRLRISAEELTAFEVVNAVESIPRITKCPLGIEGHQKLCPLHRLLDEGARCVEESFADARISHLLSGKRSKTCTFTANFMKK